MHKNNQGTMEQRLLTPKQVKALPGFQAIGQLGFDCVTLFRS